CSRGSVELVIPACSPIKASPIIKYLGMGQTALYERLVAAGAQLGDYLGTETALRFGDARAEFRELCQGCGIYDLGWRAKILVTGNDRVRWLNGMVTNNIRDLAVNRGNYNFLLSAQGRIQADMYIYNRGEYLLVDTAQWQAPKVLELFDKFIIMDDVEITDASDKLTALAVQGPRSREVLERTGFLPSDVEPSQVVDGARGEIGYSVARKPSDVSCSYELWIAPSNAAAVWDALTMAGARPVGTDALEMFRVWAGIPRYGQDIRERELPQEIVERIRSRGQVHRKFTGFVVQGAPPPAGTKVVAEGKEVGEITSATTVPVNGEEKTLALGYIRREAGIPGTVVQVDGADAKVAMLPFKTDAELVNR